MLGQGLVAYLQKRRQVILLTRAMLILLPSRRLLGPSKVRRPTS
jgi:hypothetical protein